MAHLFPHGGRLTPGPLASIWDPFPAGPGVHALGRGQVAGWSGSPSLSAHTEGPQSPALLSPQSGQHSVGGPRTWRVGQRRRGCMGEMLEMNTAESPAARRASWEKGSDPGMGQPPRTLALLSRSRSPQGPPATRPHSPASGSRLHSLSW